MWKCENKASEKYVMTLKIYEIRRHHIRYQK